MNTTEVIEMLKRVEFGASGRPREISFEVNGNYISEPKLEIASTGDGIAGAQLCLSIESEGKR